MDASILWENAAGADLLMNCWCRQPGFPASFRHCM